jgi:polyphenol oxidase
MLQTISPGIYSLDFFGSEVLAGFSGREFDNARHADFLSGLGVSADRFIKPKQVHGSEILLVDSVEYAGEDPEADGLMTQTPGLALGIMTADCVPVFYWDPEKKVAALAHAGWRGIHAGIVKKMPALFSKYNSARPELLKVALGPCIRRCCYEVGEEFKLYFPDFFEPVAGLSKGYVDLPGTVKNELALAGVRSENIFDCEICTSCSNAAFFSARRDKSPERILSVIQIV